MARLDLLELIESPVARTWRPVGDPVMGGVSISRVSREGGTLIFEGRVSRDFGGGFASVEANVPIGTCAGYRAIELSVRGDGLAYRLRAKPEGVGRASAYQARFETHSDRVTECTIVFDAMQATRRGRPIESPGLDPARIDRIGLLIADGHEGPFRIEVQTLYLVR